MFTRLFLTASLLFSISAVASAAEPWYQKDQKPTTLKSVFAEDANFLGDTNPGYLMMGSAKLCATLWNVKVPCDYNSRFGLSMFLTVNGKGLFPASSGTNPHYTEAIPGRPDDGFIGTAKQNAMLRAAVAKNALLFKDGDLTVDALKDWN